MLFSSLLRLMAKDMEGSPNVRPPIEQSPLGKAFRIFGGASNCVLKILHIVAKNTFNCRHSFPFRILS